MSKTRINIYLDESVGEAFKRFCRSRRKSYSEILEPIIYRLLSTPTTNNESSLTTVQSQIHDAAVHAYRQVYESNRQVVIDSAVSSSESEVEDVSPQIPMPQSSIPTPEVNHHGRTPRTNRLSKREISR